MLNFVKNNIICHLYLNIETEFKRIGEWETDGRTKTHNMVVIKYNNVLKKDIQILSPEKMRNGMGVICKISPVQIQLPEMRLPWKCAPLPPMSGSGPPACKLALAFEDQVQDLVCGEQKTLAAMLKRIDKQILDHVVANKTVFFPKKAPSDSLLREELFYTSIKEHTDSKYPPTFQVKVPFEARVTVNQTNETEDEPSAKRVKMDVATEETFDLLVPCYSKEGFKMSPDKVLNKGNKVIAMVSPQHIWQINNRCGITWKISKCMATVIEENCSSFDFDIS